MENTEKNCCICGSNVTLVQVREKWICEECLHNGNEKRTALWKDSIEKIAGEYHDACDKCITSDEPEEIHMARVLGRRLQSVLQFIGLPKKHALLLPIKKADHILKKIGESNKLLDMIAEQNEENNVNAEMVKLLSIMQKKAGEQLAETMPNLLNDSYFARVKTFLNEELNSHILFFVKEDALQNNEERFNELLEAYEQSAEKKGKTSASTMKILHKIRKAAKSQSDIYHWLNDLLGDQFQEKETYYIDIQRQMGRIIGTEDWMNLLKSNKKKSVAPKKEKNAIKDKLKERLALQLENVEFHPVLVKEL